MQLNNQDFAVIKYALKVALEHDLSGQASYSYREVLAKLNRDRRTREEHTGLVDGEESQYDYDDAAEI
ncbi:MAG: hypothetical protein K0Q59_4959 [Paenibacillus sp.]|jgi:hypothetical protein|nr:hypothetical protein [Paenibacillus sp.]